MEIIWHGQSCFEIIEDDYCVVIDPFQPGSVGTAFPDIDLEADEVLISHEHRDHNYREGVKLRSGKTSPFTVTTVETYHDPLKGRMRGLNTVHILDTGKLRVVHLGDIGVTPTPEQIELFKGCDVLMIPTGGFQVIEPQAAFFLTEKIQPRVAIPMHFNAEGHSNWRLWKREEYTEAFQDFSDMPVKVYDVNRLTVTEDTERHVAALALPGAVGVKKVFPRA